GDRESKLQVAAAHGARGVLFLESTMLHEVYPVDEIAKQFGRPGMVWAEPDGKAHMPAGGLPVAGTLSFAGAAKPFQGARFDWPAILAADAAGKKLPTGPLGVGIASHQTAVSTSIASVNVVGLLRGSDPTLAAETVVLSAHLDHIGVGRPDAT